MYWISFNLIKYFKIYWAQKINFFVRNRPIHIAAPRTLLSRRSRHTPRLVFGVTTNILDSLLYAKTYMLFRTHVEWNWRNISVARRFRGWVLEKNEMYLVRWLLKRKQNRQNFSDVLCMEFRLCILATEIRERILDAFSVIEMIRRLKGLLNTTAEGKLVRLPCLCMPAVHWFVSCGLDFGVW
jgi:hypothetical protein